MVEAAKDRPYGDRFAHDLQYIDLTNMKGYIFFPCNLQDLISAVCIKLEQFFVLSSITVGFNGFTP